MTYPLRPSAPTKTGMLDPDELSAKLEAHISEQRLQKERRIARAQLLKEAAANRRSSVPSKASRVLGIADANLSKQKDSSQSRPKLDRASSSCPDQIRTTELEDDENTPPVVKETHISRFDPEIGVFRPQRRRLDQDPVIRARYADQTRPLSTGDLDWEDQPDPFAPAIVTNIVGDRTLVQFSPPNWSQSDEIKVKDSLMKRTKSLLYRRRQSSMTEGASPGETSACQGKPATDRKHSFLGRIRKDSQA